MRAAGLSHLVVYADREHFANLAWLTGFDPRFEEALLILGFTADPLLLTGIECAGYLPISPLYREGKLRTGRWDDFSLPGIPRTEQRAWPEIFRGEAIAADSHVGLCGWKTYQDPAALDVPAYLADALRAIGSHLTNAASLFSCPATGLRSTASPAEIAHFEWANIAASEGMKNLLHGLQEGAADYELAPLMQYNGSPQTCHWTLKTGPNRISLASPKGDVIARGNTFSANIAYRGANCCRAGWLVEKASELPAGASDYFETFVAPYVLAMKDWFAHLTIGQSGGILNDIVTKQLEYEMFRIKLNPGHLIHLEEWLSTPIYPESTIALRSGMVLQSDVIPSHPVYFSTRMEDSYLLASEELRAALPPAVLSRCLARRDFMRHALGYTMSDDVLPLSNLAGVIQPYLFAPELAVTLSQ